MVIMMNTMKIQQNCIETKKNPKFIVGDNVRISNIKTFLLKNIPQIGQKKFLVINKIKNTAPWTYAISDLNGD